MQARGSIRRQRRGADEFRKLSRGRAALQIHLEKALLRVQIPQRPGEIGARTSLERWRAASIPFYADRRRETGRFHLAIELWHAEPQQKAAGKRRDERRGGGNRSER